MSTRRLVRMVGGDLIAIGVGVAAAYVTFIAVQVHRYFREGDR